MRTRTVGDRIRIARKDLGISASALDEAANLTRCHVAQIESGRKQDIETHTAVAITRALQKLGSPISLEWLITGVGVGPEKHRRSA